MGNNTNHGHFFKVGIPAILEFRALVRTSPDASNFEPLLLLMMEGKSCTDVTTSRCRDIATLRRRYVVTSRRCFLLTVVLVDPTSRRWDVTTWGRRDVGTSRRSSHLHTFFSTAPNCFQSSLFSTHLHLDSPN